MQKVYKELATTILVMGIRGMDYILEQVENYYSAI